MRYLLEYNEERHNFHFNCLQGGCLHVEPASFGWMPVCLITEDMDEDMDFFRLRTELASKKSTYREVVTIVSKYILEHYDSIRTH